MSATPWNQRSLAVDFSKWQGTVRVDELRGIGVEAAFFKASQGLQRDPAFAANWLAIRGRMDRGAYHWLMPDAQVREQAEFFARTVGKLDPLDTIWVDFEEPSTVLRGLVLIAALRTFLIHVEALTGKECGIYTGRYYWMQYCAQLPAPDIGARANWHAEYPALSGGARDYSGRERQLTAPHPALPWSTPVIWQFDGDKGLVLPSGTDCDFNVLDLAELRAVAQRKPPAIDDTPTRPDAPAPIRRSSASMPAVRPGSDELTAVPERGDLWPEANERRDTDPAPPPDGSNT